MDASLVLVAGGLATLAALPLAESWRTIMRNLGSDLPRRAAYRVFFIGQLAKYLPGSVWSVVGHAEVASAHGIGRGRTATASVLNLGVVAATGAALGVPALLFGTDVGPAAWLVLGVVPLMLVLLNPRVLNRAISFALRRLGRPDDSVAVSGRALLRASAWAILGWVLYGAHIALLLRSLHVEDNRLLLIATCGFALAWVAGMLVPDRAGRRRRAGDRARRRLVAGRLTIRRLDRGSRLARPHDVGRSRSRCVDRLSRTTPQCRPRAQQTAGRAGDGARQPVMRGGTPTPPVGADRRRVASNVVRREGGSLEAHGAFAMAVIGAPRW